MPRFAGGSDQTYNIIEPWQISHAPIEMHAAGEVPGGISPFQELLQRLLRFGEFGAASRINFSPQRGEHFGVQIFPARHRRCGVRQFPQHFHRRRFDGAHRGGAGALSKPSMD